MQIEVLGVYPVPEAAEPCHLVELRVLNHRGVVEIGSFYQPPRQKHGNEQTPYLEHLLNADGTDGEEFFGDLEVNGEVRFAFFMLHALSREELANRLPRRHRAAPASDAPAIATQFR